MDKPVLDLDQLELNGIRIHDAHEEGAMIKIKYFKNDAIKEIDCYIDEPMSIWEMIIKCSNDDMRVDIPFNWIVQVENI